MANQNDLNQEQLAEIGQKAIKAQEKSKAYDKMWTLAKKTYLARLEELAEEQEHDIKDLWETAKETAKEQLS